MSKNKGLAWVIILVWAAALPDSAAFSGEANPEKEFEEMPREKMSIPENLDECFAELKRILTQQQLNEFMNKKEEDAVTEAHSGLGRRIRNEWIRPSASPLGNEFLKMGLSHPDDMSSLILGAFWCHLNGKPLRIEERVKEYNDYWKYVVIPKNIVSPKDGSPIKFIANIPCEDPGAPKNCRTHFGVSQSDGTAWVYQWGKGVFEPDEDLKNQILSGYKKYLENHR